MPHKQCGNGDSSEKIKLVYICGAARSGSTVLGLLLEQVAGFCHVGELYHIWSRGFLQDERCSCGLKFSSCPFWRRVTEEAFGGQPLDVGQIKKDIRFVQKMRKLPQMLLPWLRGSEYKQKLQSHATRLIKLYEAIRTVSGSRIIVDSSKSPLYAILLSRIPSMEIHTVHLIRDSRAVAFSWQRKKLRNQPDSMNKYMPTHGPWQSAFNWNLANLLSQGLRIVSVSYQKTRYEDLVENVPDVLSRLISPLQEVYPPSSPAEAAGSSIRGHAVSGNPLRFQGNIMHIALDDEWKARMARKERFIATATTFPLLLYYGYRF